MSAPNWTQVVAECERRISELTALCIASDSTESQIRVAQAGITECRRLMDLPDRLAATAQQQGAASKRREY